MVSRRISGRWLRNIGIVLLLVLARPALSLVRAERPAAPQLLPESTLIYARIADAQDTAQRFRETSMGRILQDPQMEPFVSDLWKSATEAFDQVGEELDVTLDELLRIPQGEICLALVGATEGPPALVVLFEVKDQLPTIQKLIDRGLQEAEADGATVTTEVVEDQEMTLIGGVGPRNRELVMFIRDGVIVLTSDKELSKQLLDIWDGEADMRTLADNKKFTAIMSQSVGTKDERPQISWYVDPIELFRNVGRGNLGAQTGLALLGPLGLDGFEAVGGSMILAAEEFDSISHFHVLLKSPRQAVLKMLAMEAGELDPETWVPKDAASYMTVYWDLDTTFAELAEIYDLVNLRQGAFSEVVKSRLSDQIGIDVQSELLPALAGRFTMVSRIQRPVRLNSETSGVAFQVKDGQEFAKIIDKVVAKFPDAIERAAFGSTTYYRLRMGNPPSDFDDELMRAPEPAFLLLGDYVIFSDSVQFLEQCVITQSEPGNSLADDLEFKLVASRIQRHSGGRAPGMLVYARPEEQLRAIYELATADARKQRLSQAENNPVFGALNRALNDNPLPPFAVIAQYLAPSGGIMINDDTGFHYIAFSLRSE